MPIMKGFFISSIVVSLAVLSSVTSIIAAPMFSELLSSNIRPERQCGTAISPERRAAAEDRFRTHRIPAGRENATAVIDVYFHVFYANETAEGGFVSDEVIDLQMNVLNNDYNATGLSFNLVQVDRYEDENLFLSLGPESESEATIKQELRQGEASILNIYTTGFKEGTGKGLLGYATFPFDYESEPHMDGVVLLHTTMPENGPPPYNGGRTLTHEVGHWMGLYHTFEGGCKGDGDDVDDTPAARAPVYGCPTEQKPTCPDAPPALLNNFMEYTDDNCMTGFSQGQITRLRQELRVFRGVEL